MSLYKPEQAGNTPMADIRYCNTDCRTAHIQLLPNLFQKPKIENATSYNYYALRVDMRAHGVIQCAYIDSFFESKDAPRKFEQIEDNEAIKIISIPAGSSYPINHTEEASYTFFTFHTDEANEHKLNVSLRSRKVLRRAYREGQIIKENPEDPAASSPDLGTISIDKPEPFCANSPDIAAEVYKQDIGYYPYPYIAKQQAEGDLDPSPSRAFDKA